MDSGRGLVTGLTTLMTTIMTTTMMMGSCEAVDIPVAAGTTISLTPHTVHTKDIVWKHKGNLVVEWLNSELEYFSVYKGRTHLDTGTGQLSVSGVTLADTGVFTVEVDSNIQQEGYNVTVYNNVLKPKVVSQTLACDHQSTACIFDCSSDVTGAGPVSYSWKVGKEEWMRDQKTGSFELHKSEETVKAEKIFCRIKNPFSEEESDSFPNPFYHAPIHTAAIVGIIVGICAACVLVGIGVWKKKTVKKLVCPGGQDDGCRRVDAHDRTGEKSNMELLGTGETTGDKTNSVP